MNPRSIYSKSGKGVQEASGKTSLLKRGDRAVLSAIDGRATLAEVAQKLGKAFDGSFQVMIAQLDKDGFIREVSAPGASSTTSQPVAAVKPAKAVGGANDLDFTSVLPKPKAGAAPARAADTRATGQEAALYKARQEAEARAQAERDRLRTEMEAKARADAEAKIRTETEKKLREEAAARSKAEAKARAQAEAERAKAARELAARMAAEAKAKAEAEAREKIEAERKAREEAERKAREEAERARAEAERVRREAEELRQRLEEERKAREEAERKAREEAERKAREEAERKAREEAERKAREQAERQRREEEERQRKAEEERRAREEAERKARDEAERLAREQAERAAREEAERVAREEAERVAREEAERQAREEAEQRKAREEEERVRRAQEQTRFMEAAAAAPTLPAAPDPEATSLDALMADLNSVSQREEERRAHQAGPQEQDQRAAQADEERRAREDEERRVREEEERRAREEEERRAREEEERRAQEEAAQRAREEQHRAQEEQRRQEEERRRLEEEQRRAEEEQRRAEEEQRRAQEERRLAEEAAERVRKAREAAAAALQASAAPVPLEDIPGDEERAVTEAAPPQAKPEKRSRKAQRGRDRAERKRQREAQREEREARERAAALARQMEARRAGRHPRKWGRTIATTLAATLILGVGALHVMPLPMDGYERAATAALGRPVRIDSGRLSLVGGVHLDLEGVRIGEGVRIARMQAYPWIGSLFGERTAFKRVELERLTVAQEAIGQALFGGLKGENFSIARILVKQLRVDGPLAMPPLEVDAVLGTDGTVRSVRLSGPDELSGMLTPADKEVQFELTAASFTLPFAPEVILRSFAMKGRATHQGLRVDEWGGALFDGAVSGVANVSWSSNWEVNGAITARGINAAVFAPALLSEGRAEGSGKFTMSGDPRKLANGARLEGSFTVTKGVLGTFDLSRVIQTGGRQHAGRTQFVELKAAGVYDRGAVALRDVAISAGALSAGANADIAQNGALSGRIVADVRTASHSMRQTILLGGTVKEPQVRN